MCEGDFEVLAVVSMTLKTWTFLLTWSPEVGVLPLLGAQNLLDLVLSTGPRVWDLWASLLFPSQLDPKAISSLAAPLSG